MDPVTGTNIEAELKDPATTAEQALEKLAKLQKAVEDEAISKEKFTEEMKELLGEIRELRADQADKMRFDAGDTRAIVAEGGMRRSCPCPQATRG